jgi:ubiquinone/menaquinone biosynthesis C-methylase UbiE
MIARLLEPEAMETPESVREYDAMDHAEVNERFVADFLAAHGPCRGGEILDVGTGTARIPIALARADEKACVLAVDLAATMLDQAAVNIAAAGLSHRIHCEQVDAKLLLDRFGAASFEGVISNTIIHHIPDPEPAMETMAQLVAKGGTLLVRDLARPDTHAEVLRLKEAYTAGESPDAQALFEASLIAALTLDEIRAIVKRLGHREADVAMTSDRHWTWIWRR